MIAMMKRGLTKRVITDISGQSEYLVRWSLWLPFGLSLKLHKIVREDDDRCAHDHPWWFLRIILWGGYLEACGTDNHLVHRKPWRPWAPWRIYFCPRSFRHRILELPEGVSWTLLLCGPNQVTWGFYTTRGWMLWETFVYAARSKRILWCDDGRSLGEESDA